MRLVAVGDNVVDCYPRLGLMFPGGNALGAAVHARRSGAYAGYVGAIGHDPAGQLIRHALDAEAVDATRLRVLRGSTATATVELMDGERSFLGNDKGISLIKLHPDDLEYISSFDIAHTTCYSRFEERVPSLGKRTRVSYDFSHRREPGYALPLLPYLYLATFSGDDLPDDEAEDLLRWPHSYGPRYVLVTMGRRGAMLHDGRRTHRQRARATTLVDSLGAGDSFIARTLVGVLRGEPVPRTLAAAADIAATTCRHHGSFGGPGRLPPATVLPTMVADVSTIFLNRQQCDG